MEKLSLPISEAIQEGKWHPIKVSKEGLALSHLFFADDVLLFSKATCSQTKFMAELFAKFSASSGLKVNVAKSRAYFSKGVTRRKVDKISAISSIRSAPSLHKYLGFLIFESQVKKRGF